MLEHAFYNLNLQRIELTVLEDNVRARVLYEKAGFVQEGFKRKSKYKNGKFVNTLLYSILKDEYGSKWMSGEMFFWTELAANPRRVYEIFL